MKKPASDALDIDQYRSLIHLDEPFEAPEPVPEVETQRAKLADRLLTHLQSENTGLGNPPSIYEEKRRLLRALLTVRGPDPLPLWFHWALGRLLQREKLERNRTAAISLPRIIQSLPKSTYKAAARCALWQGDITTLKVDAIVNAANEQMLGCFQPFHACIDTAIHSAAGPRLREDCNAIMQLQRGFEGTGWAKVTRAYHLPSKYVLHTVGPIVDRGRVFLEHEQQLENCYRACLDAADRVDGIRSVAFCSISTGVFGFPQEPAAAIALRTVGEWLANHPGRLDLVVFNLYRKDDLEIYSNLLLSTEPP